MPILVLALFGSAVAQAQITSGKSYRIITTCGTGTKVMAIAGASTSNSALAVIETRNNSKKSQIFKFDSSNGAYTVTAIHSGKLLDVKARSMVNGGVIQQYDNNGGGANQLFRVTSPSAGIYQLTSVLSGLKVDLKNASTTDGNGFIQYQASTSCSQKFKLEEVVSSRDAFALIQAESMNEQSGGFTDPAQTGMQGVVGGLNSGNYLKYNQVNFGDGGINVTINLGVADGFGGKTIELRQDSLTGPLLGNFVTQSTGGWQTIKAQSANITKTTGLHDLYLVMKGDAIANLDSFVFGKASIVTPAPAPIGKDAFSIIQAESMNEQSGGFTDPAQTGMQGVVGGLNNGNYLKYNQVNFGDGALSVSINLGVGDGFGGKTIELRQDSLTGPLLGSFVTQSTGGWQTIKAQAANITKIIGLHDLYLVMKGDAVANLDSFVFGKASVAAPAPAPTPTGSTNSVDLIISDMVKMHDMKVQNITATGAWATGPGHVGIGRDATKIAPWGEVFIGQGNAATNSRVQIKNWRIYWQRSSDRKWFLFRTVTGPEGGFYGTNSYQYSGQAVSFRTESEGFAVQRPPATSNISWAHFWSTTPYESMAPEKGNIRALMITAQYRLILDNPNGVDDRDKALYMVRIGMDDPTHIQPGYISAILGTRAKKATKEWQSITGFTLDASTGVNVWENISPNYGISEAELRSNPPPLD